MNTIWILLNYFFHLQLDIYAHLHKYTVRDIICFDLKNLKGQFRFTDVKETVSQIVTNTFHLKYTEMTANMNDVNKQIRICAHVFYEKNFNAVHTALKHIWQSS